jgi:hypothetical protein
MTRRKDKLKQKQEYIRKSLNESKSRIYQKQEEIKSENNLILHRPKRKMRQTFYKKNKKN